MAPPTTRRTRVRCLTCYHLWEADWAMPVPRVPGSVVGPLESVSVQPQAVSRVPHHDAPVLGRAGQTAGRPLGRGTGRPSAGSPGPRVAGRALGRHAPVGDARAGPSPGGLGP